MDIPNDESGGDLTLTMSGISGTDLILVDEPGEFGSWDQGANQATVTWYWLSCCNDGLIMGPISVDQCITFSVNSSSGLIGTSVLGKNNVSYDFSLNTTIEICGDL